MYDVRNKLKKIKQNVTDVSCPHIIRVMNIMPKFCGFPLMSDKIGVVFWTIHITLSIYIYIFGVVAYQMYHSVGYIDTISSVFNMFIAVLQFNDTFWFLIKRAEINDVFKLVLENDADIIDQGRHFDIYRSLLKITKIIVITCYSFHFINDILIFVPSRTLDMESFTIVSCVGMDPLNASPDRECCILILIVQELTSAVVVMSYDSILLFLFSHTTAIFIVLCKDTKDFSEITNKFDGSIEMKNLVRKRLQNLITRHTKILHTIRKLKKLFSFPIGVLVVVNVIAVCTFFALSLDAALTFGPLIYYTLTVFFLYCLLGQRLINAAEDFEEEVYCCGWEKLELVEQKMILFMLGQAQKPVMLHAVDMVPICMATFADTMQAIYSLITVFKV